MQEDAKKPIAVVLGGTNPHVALVRNLSNRGYYVVLVDYYENPPARAVAHLHLRESTLDKEKVLEICLQLDVALVISVAVDQANAVACYVSEKLGLPRPYSYETALSIGDKARMKEVLVANGIPTARHMVLEKTDRAKVGELGYPIVLKPADGTGSKGVRKATNYEEAIGRFDAALDLSRNGKVVVEEFISGYEASVDCVVREGQAKVVLVRRKYGIVGGGDEAVLQCLVSLCPMRVSAELKVNLDRAISSIVDAFGLVNTSLLVQVFITGDKLNVIEFAPRVGGGLSFRTVFLSSGYDILDYTVNSYLNEKESKELSGSADNYLTVNLYADECTFREVLNVDDLLSSGVIEEFYSYKATGSQILSDMSARSRIGAFIVKGDTVGNAVNKMRKAIEVLRVIDVNGEDRVKRSVYGQLVIE